MSSNLNISGGSNAQAYYLYAKTQAEQQAQSPVQPTPEATQALQQAAAVQPQLSAPSGGNPAAGPSAYIGLVQGPPPGTGAAAQQLPTRPLLAGGHADKNNQATQGTGSASATSTIATYGVTAVTAINGTSGTNLDLLA